MKKETKKNRFSYKRHKKEIYEWLSNVTSLNYELQKKGTCPIHHLDIQLMSLTEDDSAFLTTSGNALYVHIGSKESPEKIWEVWKFTK